MDVILTSRENHEKLIRWRFDKTGYHQNGNGKVFCFIKEE